MSWSYKQECVVAAFQRAARHALDTRTGKICLMSFLPQSFLNCRKENQAMLPRTKTRFASFSFIFRFLDQIQQDLILDNPL